MKNRANWLLAAFPLVFLLVLLVAPALRLLVEGGQLSWWAPLQDSYLRWRLAWSFLQAGVTCVLALGLGLPVAWVLARFEFAGRAFVLHALMLPFVVPTLVAAMGVLALLGPQGVVKEWGGPDLQGSPWLLIYGNLFFNLCLVVRASRVAERLGFAVHRSNELLHDGSALTGKVGEPILDRDAKLATLRELAAARGWTEEDALAVGDGFPPVGAGCRGRAGRAGRGLHPGAGAAGGGECGHDHAGLHPSSGRAAGDARPPPDGVSRDGRTRCEPLSRCARAHEPVSARCGGAGGHGLPDRS